MMDCQQVRLMLSEFLDGHVVETELRMVSVHLGSCPDCASRLDEHSALRQALRGTPSRPVPPLVSMQLHSLGSQEAARRRRYAGLVGWLKHWGEAAAFQVNAIMRPFALPAAGGLASAVFLFTMVMTNFQGIVRAHADDVPTILATGATMKSSLDFTLAADEVAVDIFVDELGRVMDYSFPDGSGALNTPATRRMLENSLLFTRFQPATTFGQPTAGWVRVSLRKSEIDVTG